MHVSVSPAKRFSNNNLFLYLMLLLELHLNFKPIMSQWSHEQIIVSMPTSNVECRRRDGVKKKEQNSTQEKTQR